MNNFRTAMFVFYKGKGKWNGAENLKKHCHNSKKNLNIEKTSFCEHIFSSYFESNIMYIAKLTRKTSLKV